MPRRYASWAEAQKSAESFTLWQPRWLPPGHRRNALESSCATFEGDEDGACDIFNVLAIYTSAANRRSLRVGRVTVEQSRTNGQGVALLARDRLGYDHAAGRVPHGTVRIGGDIAYWVGAAIAGAEGEPSTWDTGYTSLLFVRGSTAFFLQGAGHDLARLTRVADSLTPVPSRT